MDTLTNKVTIYRLHLLRYHSSELRSLVINQYDPTPISFAHMSHARMGAL